MSLALKPDKLREGFFALRDARGIADLLEIPYSLLVYHLHKIPIAEKYTKFTIPKKSGGVREIDAPVTALKIIQMKLSQILYAVYSPNTHVHGFVIGRNVV